MGYMAYKVFTTSGHSSGIGDIICTFQEVMWSPIFQIFTESVPRPIQFISCNVRDTRHLTGDM